MSSTGTDGKADNIRKRLSLKSIEHVIAPAVAASSGTYLYPFSVSVPYVSMSKSPKLNLKH